MTPRILIVDDDPEIVELLRLALTAAGYSVRGAANGQEALRKAFRAPPDLVVLDLVLPGMNGFSVCEQLRRNTATASVPILMITVLTGEFPRLVGAEAGADAYLNKPFRMEELVACVDGLVRRRAKDAEVPAAPPQPVAEDTMPLLLTSQGAPGTHLRLRAHA
jgi:DNA-binding response OmpR family regulator